MKVAVLYGKNLIDIIFLNQLSDIYPDLDIDCFADSGSVSYGSRILQIKDIKKFEPDKYHIILNLSNYFDYMHELILKSEAIYINLNHGELLVTEGYYNNKVLKIPCFALNPAVKFLNTVKEKLVSLNVVSYHSICEYGKEAMNKFHKELKESSHNISNEDSKAHSLAFNISFCEQESLEEFKSSKSELIFEQQLKKILGREDLKCMITASIVPVNKASCLVINFELNFEISLENLKKMIEKTGITYLYQPISSILVENDDQIFASRLRKTQNLYSIVLIYDSLYRRVADLIEVFDFYLAIKN